MGHVHVRLIAMLLGDEQRRLAEAVFAVFAAGTAVIAQVDVPV